MAMAGGAMQAGGAAALARRFYATRAAAGDAEALRPFLAPGVEWVEPEVGAHMERLSGADAVLGTIRCAQAATGGSFRPTIVETVEAATCCAALVAWSAERGGRAVRGRELAVFGVAGGRIVSARFFPECIADDLAFRGESGSAA
jgi:ketosteroid isomerase-like protein